MSISLTTSTRVCLSSVDDWQKLIHYMQYMKHTWKDVLTLSADDLHIIKWYVDTSFAVHQDFKSHMGAVMTMGEGTIQTICSKQKLSTRSLTELELVGGDDSITKILWTHLFIEAQGYKKKENSLCLYQDSKSTILLIKNGCKSTGKRLQAINIRYFYCGSTGEGVSQHEVLPNNTNVGQPYDKTATRFGVQTNCGSIDGTIERLIYKYTVLSKSVTTGYVGQKRFHASLELTGVYSH